MRLPPIFWVGAIGVSLMIITMVVLLAVMLGSMGKLNRNLNATNQKMSALQSTVAPVTRKAKPFLRKGPPFLDNTGDELRVMLAYVSRMGPAVGSMSGTAVPVLRALGATAVPLLRELQATDLKAVVEDTGRASILFQDMVERSDLTSTFILMRQLLMDANRRDLVAKLDKDLAVLPRVAKTMKTLRSSALISLKFQRITRRQFKESLAIQREALEHIRNIDRKTGGEVPPEVPPSP